MTTWIKILRASSVGIKVVVILPLWLFLFFPLSVWSNPISPQVVSGSATFNSVGSTLTVTNSNQAIIHWQDFSIQAGETTIFNQASAASSVLNRVVGGNMSSIYGSLQSNGKVFLVNPNGILIGPTGSIDTAGFVASTLDVTDNDFLGGGPMKFVGASTQSVTNLGNISAAGGNILLIARQVNNAGHLSAPNGTVGLYASDEVYLTEGSGDQALVRIGSASDTRQSSTGILNSGTIEAARAELKATGNLYALAVNNSGSVRATGTQTIDGVVHLIGKGGAIKNTGVIHAANHNGQGGQIETSADSVDLRGSILTGKGGKWLIDPLTLDGNTSIDVTTLEGQLNSGDVTEQAMTSILLDNDNLTWSGTGNLTLQITGSGGGTINLNGMIGAANGGLFLDAGYGGTIFDSSALSVARFQLQGGTWNQNAASLPNFFANNFQITGGTFIRVTGGDGNANPYQISDVYGLQGMGSSGMLQDKYVLANDIDASGTSSWNAGAGFSPIGNNSDFAFGGTLDGQHHSIGGLTINSTNGDLGLFGYTSSSSNIMNVNLTGASITGGGSASGVGGLVGVNSGNISNSSVVGTIYGSNGVGGVVGNNYGAISNSSFSGNVSGSLALGGIAGYNYGTVTNSTTSGSISGTQFMGGIVGYNNNVISFCSSSSQASGVYDAGGIAGDNLGSINNSTASGDISIVGSSSYVVGGLVGYNNGTISNSSSSGHVTGTIQIGGFVGYNNGTISNCFSTGNVSATNNSNYFNAGGFVGQNEVGGTISKSYSSGMVLNTSNITYVGGFVGYNNGTISNSYATGDVLANFVTGGAVGGFAGVNDSNGQIINCYATGNVSGSASNGGSNMTEVGGLIGLNNGYVNSSYSVGTVMATGSGAKSDPFIAQNNGTKIGGGAVSMAYLQDTANFPGESGWDFTNTWSTNAGGYPQLGLSRGGAMVTFSGTAFTDDGINAVPDGSVTISYVINGQNYLVSLTGSGGYDFSISQAEVQADPLFLYMTGSYRGNTIFAYSGSSTSISGVDLWNNTVMTIGPLSNTLLARALVGVPTSAALFTMDGAHNIVLNPGINFNQASGLYNLDANINAASGGGSVVFRGPVYLGADSVVSSDSGIEFDSTIDGPHSLDLEALSGGVSLGGDVGATTALTSFTLNSPNAPVLIDHNITTQGGGITIRGSGTSATAVGVNIESSTLNANGGNILLVGSGGQYGEGNNWGVEINGSTIMSGGNGSITIQGTGGTAALGNHGVKIVGGSTVSVQDGTLSITGTGGSGTSDADGIVILDTSIVQSTGAGAINLTGTGGTSGAGNSYGVVLYDSSLVEATGSGVITLTGTGYNGIQGLYTGSSGMVEGSNIVLHGTGGIGGDYGFSVFTTNLTATNLVSGDMTLSNNAYLSDVVLGGLTTESGSNISYSQYGGGTVTQTGAIIANGLELLGSATSYDLTNPNNQVSTLAAYTYSQVDPSFTFQDGVGTTLTIGTVNGTSGITVDGPITINSPGQAGAVVVSQDISSNGGDISIYGSSLTVASGTTVSTGTGGGGSINVSGATVTGANLTTGSTGNITLNGGASDLVVSNSTLSSTTLNFSAQRDVIISGVETTNVAAADINVLADSGNTGVGGVDITSSGLLNSAGNVTIQGSNLFNNNPGNVGVLIEGGGTGDRVDAVGAITISTNSNAPAGAQVVINGSISSSGGPVKLSATGDLVVNANVTAAGPITANAGHDVSINAIVKTTGANADINLTGDVNNTGHGGVAVNTGGFVISSGNVAMTGSVLDGGPGQGQSIYIDPITPNPQVFAVGGISLQSSAYAPPDAGVSIIGNLEAGGFVRVVTNGRIYLLGNIKSPYPPLFSTTPFGPVQGDQGGPSLTMLPQLDATVQVHPDPFNAGPPVFGPPVVVPPFKNADYTPDPTGKIEKEVQPGPIINIGNIEPPLPGSFSFVALNEATSTKSQNELQSVMSQGESESYGQSSDQSTFTPEKVVPVNLVLSINGSIQPPPPVVTTQLNESISDDSEKALSALLGP